MGILKKIFKSDDTVTAPPGERFAAVPERAARITKSALRNQQTNLKQMLLHPVVTEKASFLNAQNQYIFAVRSEANKILIARAVEVVYGIKPKAVRVSWVTGKTRVRGKRRGHTANWKKAVVTLPAGKAINVRE